MRLLYFSPSAHGGLADYAHEQASALGKLDVEVSLLAPKERCQNDTSDYQVLPLLSTPDQRQKSAFPRKLSWATCILKNARVLRRHVLSGNYSRVLLGSYAEYLAPLWGGRFRALARSGIVFGAVIHDPVRDYAVGPLWWHRRSVASGYSFLREAFVHEDITLDTVNPMPRLRTTVIPHGPYRFPEPNKSSEAVREQLQLPKEAFVTLSFGHIRDGKNLDLAIKAMPELTGFYLLVAGKEQSSGQKPISYYQELAQSVGVGERCRWVHGNIPEEEVGNLFAASDLVLLSYSRDFRSASGVLNAAVSFRKPCVASSGGGNLRSVVESYGLGWFVEPDSLQALKQGFNKALRNGLEPRWEAYERENSWEKNAQIVKDRMFDQKS